MAAAAAFVLLGLTFSSSSSLVGGGSGKIGGLLEPFKEGNSERKEKKEKMKKLIDSIPNTQMDRMPSPDEMKGMVDSILK